MAAKPFTLFHVLLSAILGGLAAFTGMAIVIGLGGLPSTSPSQDSPEPLASWQVKAICRYEIAKEQAAMERQAQVAFDRDRPRRDKIAEEAEKTNREVARKIVEHFAMDGLTTQELERILNESQIKGWE